MSAPLLQIEQLQIAFGRVAAVDGLSLAVEAGRTTALVGESGSGKSVSALSVLGLLPPAAQVTGGRILFDGADLLTLSAEEHRRVRGRAIGFVSQDPLAALNPVYRILPQVEEAVLAHQRLPRTEARERAYEALEVVGLGHRARQFPHQLSGGQRQRVVIGMAIVSRPRLLIADEPTTALDVNVQREILDLLLKLRDELGMGLWLITHDLAVVAETADTVTVMQAGRVVEQNGVFELFAAPRELYTRQLLAAARWEEPADA
ncbi:MAG: ABC transporter ATP-binding protein [Armatimonadetes bacterium]|nr:ABC transporter ATP-binding protein [Armatimonadota bacterium]